MSKYYFFFTPIIFRCVFGGGGGLIKTVWNEIFSIFIIHVFSFKVVKGWKKGNFILFFRHRTFDLIFFLFFCNDKITWPISVLLDGQPEDVIPVEGLELVTNLQSLTACSAVWSSMYMREQLQSAIIHDLTHKLRDQVKAIGNQVVLFFQVRSPFLVAWFFKDGLYACSFAKFDLRATNFVSFTRISSWP